MNAHTKVPTTVMGPPGNIMNRIGRLAATCGDRAALVEPGGGRITFAELEARTARIAGGLVASGVGEGDRFLMTSSLGIPLYLALMGVLRVGGTPVLMDLASPPGPLGETLELLKLKGVVGQARQHLLRLRYPELRGLGLYLCTGGVCPLPNQSLDTLDGAPTPPAAVDGLALLTLSPGQVRGAEALGHDHLDARMDLLAGALGLRPDDVDMPTLPLFLPFSLGVGATCVLPSANLLRLETFEPAVIAAQIRAEGVTTASGTPGWFAALARHLRDRGEVLDGIRKLFICGTGVSAGRLKTIRRIVPEAEICVITSTVGADPVAVIDAETLLSDGLEVEGEIALGEPPPGTRLKIWRPAEEKEQPWWRTRPQPVKRGEIGELVVSGRHISPRRWWGDKPLWQNKARLQEWAWQRTGLLVRQDEGGRIWRMRRS